MRNFMRPATWPPSVHLLPISIGAAIWLLLRGERPAKWFIPAIIVLAVTLFVVFQKLPTYTTPSFLGFTRPTLALVPLLWLAVAAAAWHWRQADRKMRPLALMAAILTLGNIVMLYSQAPHDTPAMVAHIGKIAGRLVLLLALMRMGSQDMLERVRSERALALLNAELDARVHERTAELNATNLELESAVADQKVAAEAVRITQDRLRRTMDNITDPFVVVDEEWRFTFANREALRVLQKTETGLVGKNIWDEFPTARGSVFEANYRNAFRTQATVSFTEHFAAMDKWFLVNAYPSIDGLAIYFQDVTTEKQQQEQVRLLEGRVEDRTAELEAANLTLQTEVGERCDAERRTMAQFQRVNLLYQITRAIGGRQDLASIFQVTILSVEDQLPADFCCLCLRDETGSALRISAIGLRSEALGVALVQQGSIEVAANGLERCLQGELVYEPELGHLDLPLIRQLTGQGLGSVVFAPVQVESNLFGVMVVARKAVHGFSSGDCEFLRQMNEHVALATHQNRLYEALQTAYDDLRQSQQAVMQQERMRALGEMASGIAHDINNALTPASIYTDSLLEDETLDQKRRGVLEIVRRAIEDVAHTVGRMRDFYRKPEEAVELTALDINAMIRQAVDLTRASWSDMAIKRGIVIDVVLDLAPDLPPVMGIESEIREALINLLLNAIDAVPLGGRVDLRTAVIGTGGAALIRVEVADNGIGMDEETRRRCLEPFFTTKGERGTGLGLGMVYGVLQRHGAEMDIESALGRGTTMRMLFPAADPDQLRKPEEAPQARLSRLRLLLVDDDPILLNALREILEQDGHLIEVANGGAAGIAAFQGSTRAGRTFSAVITDLGMPHVDGAKVAAAVKAEAPTTPVIMLTGWGQRMIAGDDIPPNVDKVLSKPPKLRDLRLALATLCSEENLPRPR
jgi:PAS domain S-box-containing protein